MMNQCEALVTGKQQKMSVLRSFKPQATKAITFSEDDEKEEQFLLKEVRVVLRSIDIHCHPINVKFLFGVHFLFSRVLQTEEAGEDDQKAMIVADVQPQGQLGFFSQEVPQNSFRLPPSSPYDKFLKAAGC